MSLFFKLDDDKNPVPCALEEWDEMLERNGSKRVAFDVVNGREISTVFLGLDHNHFGGRPILFETMVFENGDDIFQNRYHTWDEALEGHRNVIEWAKNGFKHE